MVRRDNIFRGVMRLINDRAQEILGHRDLNNHAKAVVVAIVVGKGGRLTGQETATIPRQLVQEMLHHFNAWDAGQPFTKKRMAAWRDILGFSDVFYKAVLLYYKSQEDPNSVKKTLDGLLQESDVNQSRKIPANILLEGRSRGQDVVPSNNPDIPRTVDGCLGFIFSEESRGRSQLADEIPRSDSLDKPEDIFSTELEEEMMALGGEPVFNLDGEDFEDCVFQFDGEHEEIDRSEEWEGCQQFNQAEVSMEFDMAAGDYKNDCESDIADKNTSVGRSSISGETFVETPVENLGTPSNYYYQSQTQTRQVTFNSNFQLPTQKQMYHPSTMTELPYTFYSHQNQTQQHQESLFEMNSTAVDFNSF
eukprot:CAMPEP_0114997798 /NCGR_PEP_ID=MMETSP0216-20121206/15108_1 /TAXON_ID=223996 /ORGANISM="Protocruzia adherens, Strain Boccale" /LENGTH=362 /DNA_ID=CAMNT_0002362237 /DNA_START=44 /DNA_END=1132 /DNA_ORIENTATION=+